ncbi:MAG: DNA polymerase III subunit gamma/tau, partial [Parcubacteria group bacterium]|nr:DNA polymerase III subunit gamma/tau [Parcubacteria group bacterium]
MSTLYRKYRPQNFEEVVGQEHIKQILQNEIKSNKIAHAFLFSGPRGIGKTTIARILSKAINCEDRKDNTSEPCNKCGACLEIIESRALDVIEMDAATHTQVDKVRENIVENVRFTPSRLKYKVFIIDEVHMLSTSAFNALLKTLEEPPAHAVFILATTEIHKIPETIISRCQRFDFHKINFDGLLTRLKMISKREGVELEEDVLHAIIKNADGGLRDAEGVLGQLLSLSIADDKKITMDEASIVLPRSNINLVKDFTSYIFKKDISSALQLIGRLGDEGVNIKRFIDETIEYLREVLSLKFLDASSSSFAGGQKEAGEIKEFIKNIPGELIVKIIEVLLERKQMAQFSKIDELPLELAVVEICGEGSEKKIQNTPEPAPIVKKIPEPIPVANNTPEPTPVVKKTIEPVVVAPTPIITISKPLSTSPEPIKSLEVSPESDISSKSLLDKIRKNWNNILNKAQEYNQSLPLVLNVGVPLKINNNTLQIGFPFPFYKERLNKDKNRDIVEKILL